MLNKLTYFMINLNENNINNFNNLNERKKRIVNVIDEKQSYWVHSKCDDFFLTLQTLTLLYQLNTNFKEISDSETSFGVSSF